MKITIEEVEALKRWAKANEEDYRIYRECALDQIDLNAADDHEREMKRFELVRKLCKLVIKEKLV